MKYTLSVLFMMIALVGFAQKKEFKKIEKAFMQRNVAEAQEIFNSIDENEVEDKYKAEYLFYKSMNMITALTGSRDLSKLNVEYLNEIDKTFQQAKALGYNNEVFVPFIESTINTSKFALVSILSQQGKYDKALELMEDLYQKNPSNKDFLFNVANIAYSANQLDKAKKHYRELVGSGYTGVTTTYLAKNKSTNAVENFKSETVRDYAIKSGSHSEPTEDKSASNLGLIMERLMWLYKENDELTAAKGLLKSVTSKYASDQSLAAVLPNIYNTLGMKEEYKKAIAANEESLKDPQVLINLGKSAFEEKKYDKAIEYFEASVKIKDDLYSYQMLANSYIEQSNLSTTTYEQQEVGYKKAIENLEKARKMNDDPNIRATLVSLYNAVGMKDKATALQK